jgi:hypothetical protein
LGDLVSAEKKGTGPWSMGDARDPKFEAGVPFRCRNKHNCILTAHSARLKKGCTVDSLRMQGKSHELVDVIAITKAAWPPRNDISRH